MSEPSRLGRSLKARALSLLAQREHTRVELVRKLTPHAPSCEVLDGVLDEMAQLGLLSDQRAAASHVRVRSTRFSKSRIEATLRFKGVDAQTISESTAELDDVDTARRVFAKKFGMVAGDAKGYARQVRFLQSRGFGISVIKVVLSGPLDALELLPGSDDTLDPLP